jgi:hypothetical protein
MDPVEVQFQTVLGRSEAELTVISGELVAVPKRILSPFDSSASS